MAGVIQAFEFTFEIFWKVIRLHAEEQGLVANSPRSALKQGFALGLLDDEPTWLQMLEDRNQTVHVYNEKLAREIHERIVGRYLGRFKSTALKLRQVFSS